MASKALILAGLVGVGLGGCAAVQKMWPASGCTANCKVEVTVADCDAPNGAGITVDTPVLSVGGRGSRKAIQWKIVTPGYHFATDGIALTGKKDPPGDEFGSGNGQGAVFTLTDNHTKKGTYTYAINIKKVGPGAHACTQLDPVISNE